MKYLNIIHVSRLYYECTLYDSAKTIRYNRYNDSPIPPILYRTYHNIIANDISYRNACFTRVLQELKSIYCFGIIMRPIIDTKQKICNEIIAYSILKILKNIYNGKLGYTQKYILNYVI